MFEFYKTKGFQGQDGLQKAILLLSAVFLFFACKKTPSDILADRLFSEMPAAVTGVDFENKLEFRQDFNIYTYRNFYNGGGVAIGDVNNDGLPDIFFTANMLPNRLYLNLGSWKFKDVSKEAGIGGKGGWSTGVVMADVNGDGWLDIYVCNSGDIDGDNRENELFINTGQWTDLEGNLTTSVFVEKAKEYGLADAGLSTHAAFFDYDKDGDLDMYLLNNSFRAIGSFDLRLNQREKRDPAGGDKLFRNDGAKFTDVSEEAGIYGSIIGFGLGITISDVNKDGWQDIYISNDFFERDYLYLNHQDGSFREVLTEQMGSISATSMGADVADINNDGWPDFFVTEMLPQSDTRIKTKTTFDSWNRYQEGVRNGYFHQFTRNTLQLNNADGTFSEIGRLAGVEATDWSWSALIQDFNNDGIKDIFVANGIYQDLTDQDFLQFIAADETKRAVISREKVDFKKLVEFIPSEAIPNYMFEGRGNLAFKNVAQEWGLARPGFSNGSAYADLDLDGDLDLVVNNVNMPCFLYRNNAETLLPENRWLNVVLKGENANTQAIGTKITAKHQGQIFYLEHNPTRGFESSIEYKAHLGLGKINTLDSLIVQWYYGKVTVLTKVPTNQVLTLEEKNGTPLSQHPPGQPLHAQAAKLFKSLPPEDLSISFEHKENWFVDFDRDRMLYHMLSTEGPKISVGDVNGDGQDDFFIGNASGTAGELYLQQNGRFHKVSERAFEKNSLSEDLGSAFFDANGDGHPDLYVCSGGSEFPTSSSALRDWLYLNDSKGNFAVKDVVLPAGRFESTSCVKPADFDGDGNMDLFVGVRVVPFYYGIPTNGYLLRNDGKGNFSNVTDEIAPGLKDLGMITDAAWLDVDGDGNLDLAVLGEWMPITIFKNEKGTFQPVELPASAGWWNCIEVGDLNGDGFPDLIAGNHGLNSRFRASEDKPVSCYINDFDQNGAIEQIICQFNGEKAYPVVLRHDLVSQMPSLKKKYLKYESYKEQTIQDIFSPEQLQNSVIHEAVRLETSIFLNDGKGNFHPGELPVEAQFSPVYAALPYDFDGDGKLDLLLGGNLYRVKPEAGRYDASYGCLLKGYGDGRFRYIPPRISGLRLTGEVRDFAILRAGGRKLLLVGRNNEAAAVFELRVEQ